VNPRGPRKLRRLGVANTGIRGAVDMFRRLEASAESSSSGWSISWLDVRGNVGINAASKAALASALHAVTLKMLHGGPRSFQEKRWGLRCAWASRNVSGIDTDPAFRLCGFSCDTFDLNPNMVSTYVHYPCSHC
jgi:hypothetical protein